MVFACVANQKGPADSGGEDQPAGGSSVWSDAGSSAVQVTLPQLHHRHEQGQR